jgi:predicted nucleotidyltransferase
MATIPAYMLRTVMKNKIIDICIRYYIGDLYVFGSRAKEIAALVAGETVTPETPRSDVDVAVFPTESRRLPPDQLVALTIELEDLFQVDRVDLVLLPDADPFLALDIIRGELLFTGDPDRQARYELYVLRRAGDLLPFQKERTRMILEEGGR